MDLIGQIYQAASKGCEFIIVRMDYFTKWVEVILMRSVNQISVIDLIKYYIIHRFNLPETIVVDQGSIFTGQDIKNFTKEAGFKIIHSSPYYTQGNG